MAAGTDVADEILDLSTTLETTDGVESVISYPTVVGEIRAEVEAQRAQALEEVEAAFAEPQAEIAALAQIDPGRAAEAQAQLDAEKEAALAQVDEEFETAFEEVFGSSAPDELNASLNLVVVATDLDSSSERIITYLRGFGVPVNVVFFTYLEDDGRRYLARSWLAASDDASRICAP